MEEEKPIYRISWITGVFMILVGIIYDVTQFALILLGIGFLVNWIISFWAFLTFAIWPLFHDVGFFNLKRGGTLGGSTIAEMLPLINAIPAWTLTALVIVLSTRAEDWAAHQGGLVGTVAKTAAKTLKGGKIK